MTHRLLFTLLALPCIPAAIAQSSPPLEWQRCLGGSVSEGADFVRATPDGGWVMAASTQSNNGDVVGQHGLVDIWLVKLSASGIIAWTRALGGSDIDNVFGLEVTGDGGCVVVGQSASSDGDVSGAHGAQDGWVVKVAATGELEWQRTLGGTGGDMALDVLVTADGGYAITGVTASNDGDFSGFHGNQDAWMAKLDAGGSTEWLHVLGGSAWEHPQSIAPTSDGGWILGITTSSNDGDVVGAHGDKDLWLLKLDATGTIQWQEAYGGSSAESFTNAFQTSDGGYILGAMTSSDDGDVVGNHGDGDYWMVKLGPSGAIQWQKTMGGSFTDLATELIITSDGGYILNGMTVSDDGDVVGQHAGVSGYEDFWVVKVSSSGTMLWARALGGSVEDNPHYDNEAWDTPSTVVPTLDGGCVLAGLTASSDGDVVGNHGLSDAWAVKLDAAGAIQWQRPLGGSNNEMANQVHLAADGGYLFSGYASSTNGDVAGNHGALDAWLVKLGSDGTGFNEPSSGRLFVAPSPAVDNVRVLTDRDMPGGWIELIDMSGRCALSERMMGRATTIDVSSLPRGQYMVSLLTPEVKLTRPLVLER